MALGNEVEVEVRHPDQVYAAMTVLLLELRGIGGPFVLGAIFGSQKSTPRIIRDTVQYSKLSTSCTPCI